MDLETLLDRERTRLRDRNGADLLRGLPDYVEFLEADRATKKLVREFEESARAVYEEFIRTQNEILEDAVLLRKQVAERAPEVDDSDIEEPDFDSHEYGLTYMFSLAHFDAIVARTIRVPMPALPTEKVDPDPVRDLLQILADRLRIAKFGDRDGLGLERRDIRPDLDDLAERLGDLRMRHEESLAGFQLASRTVPGFAVTRIKGFAGMAPSHDPEITEDGRRLLEGAWWTPQWVARRVMRGDHLEDWERNRLQQISSDLQDQLDVIHDHLVRRLTLAQRRKDLRWWRTWSRQLGIRDIVVGLVVSALTLAITYAVTQLSGDDSKNVTTVTVTTPKP